MEALKDCVNRELSKECPYAERQTWHCVDGIHPVTDESALKCGNMIPFNCTTSPCNYKIEKLLEELLRRTP